MRVLLLLGILGVSTIVAAADSSAVILAQGATGPLKPAPVFKPPPGGDRPTHNGNRPTPGKPNLPGAPGVPPRTNGEPKGSKLNPTGDRDVQRGIDEHKRSKGR
jgi:hypothetical protein